MNIYISAKWQQHPLVSRMETLVHQYGHEMSCSWTKRAYARAYDEMSAESAKFSQEEIQAILDSDILIHLSRGTGKGKYADLGIGIAGNTLQGKPTIYVIGPKNNESQFYFHPAIERIQAEDEYTALEELLKTHKKNS
jgi:hypothetical protein